MKKRIVEFIGLFFILAISYHFQEWIDHPLAHLTAVSGGGFGLGLIHPIIFTLVVYLLFTIISWLGSMIKKIF